MLILVSIEKKSKNTIFIHHLLAFHNLYRTNDLLCDQIEF